MKKAIAMLLAVSSMMSMSVAAFAEDLSELVADRHLFSAYLDIGREPVLFTRLKDRLTEQAAFVIRLEYKCGRLYRRGLILGTGGIIRRGVLGRTVRRNVRRTLIRTVPGLCRGRRKTGGDQRRAAQRL